MSLCLLYSDCQTWVPQNLPNVNFKFSKLSRFPNVVILLEGNMGCELSCTGHVSSLLLLFFQNIWWNQTITSLTFGKKTCSPFTC